MSVYNCVLPWCAAEEPPSEVKPDQSPVVLKKVEPVPLEHKLQDGAAPVAVPPAPTTTTTGSGRRKSKKQKVEALVTGKTWFHLTAVGKKNNVEKTYTCFKCKHLEQCMKHSVSVTFLYILFLLFWFMFILSVNGAC